MIGESWDILEDDSLTIRCRCKICGEEFVASHPLSEHKNVMSNKGEILEGFSVLTIAFDKMQMKAGEATWVNIGLQGKHKVIFRYGNVGIEGDNC